MSMVLILVTICQTEEVIVIASILSVLLENLSRKSKTNSISLLATRCINFNLSLMCIY